MRSFAQGVLRACLLLTCCWLVACANHKLTPAPKNQVSFHEIWHVSGGSGLGAVETKLAPNFVSHQGATWVATADYKGHVYIYDATTGKMVWKRSTGKPFSSAVGESQDAVLIGTRKGEVLALDKAQGQTLWTAQVSSEVLAAPMGDANHIAVLSIDSKVQGLKASSGVVDWIYNGTAPALKLVGATDPLLVEGAAVVGFANGQVGIFKLSDGRVLWLDAVALSRGRSEIERMVDINAKMQQWGSAVYVVTYHGKAAAIDLSHLAVIWSQEQSSYKGITVNNQVAVVTDEHDNVTAFDRTNGDIRWKQDKLQGRVLSAPAIYEHYVLIGDQDGYVNVLDVHSGEWLGRKKIGGGALRNPPLVDGQGVIFQSKSGRLVKLSVSPKRSS